MAQGVFLIHLNLTLFIGGSKQGRARRSRLSIWYQNIYMEIFGKNRLHPPKFQAASFGKTLDPPLLLRY